MKLDILDTTLRDGRQCAGVSFSPEEMLAVVHELDALGVTYIEAGDFDAGGAELDRLRRAAAEPLKNARVVAFGSTRRPKTRAEDDKTLLAAAQLSVRTVSIYGKAWTRHVADVLGTTPEENLAMIADTVGFFVRRGIEVLFDAEHFFDGYADNARYALDAVGAALDAGASAVILCDTNGGMLPDSVAVAVGGARARFPHAKLGIHCHNDLGMAVACTVAAVTEGCCHVQGTISGVGERCGNANLCTLLPLLELKLGFTTVGRDNLRSLSRRARRITELENRSFDEHEPFVGAFAFAHKAGSHIDAALKSQRATQQIDPADVGGERTFLISGLSGRAAVRELVADCRRIFDADGRGTKGGLKTSACGGEPVCDASASACGDSPAQISAPACGTITSADIDAPAHDAGMPACAAASASCGKCSAPPDKYSPEVEAVLARLKASEAAGYTYENAEASALLLSADALGLRRTPFSVLAYTVSDTGGARGRSVTATVKLEVGGVTELTAGEGNGPVNALDAAMRRALARFWPELAAVRLSDYRVRVLDGAAATGAVVRVLIETTDGAEVWRTVGVSEDIIEASILALTDAFEWYVGRR